MVSADVISAAKGAVSIDVRPHVVSALVAAALVLTGCTAAGAGAGAPAGISADGSSPGASPPPEPALTTTVDTTTAEGGAGSDEPTAEPAFTQTVVRLAPGTLDEASGIAASRQNPGAYFLIDDATGTDEVVAVAGDGSVLARIGVDGMSAGNAEALASGTCGSLPLPTDSSADTCLYLGDIGDNLARRDDIAIYRLAEPGLGEPPTVPVPADEWRYYYLDGPQNAEAMLVDADGSLLVVTKPDRQGDLPHRMYRAEPGGGELVFVREFRPPAAERPFRTLFTGNVVTDLASAPGRVLLLTYDDVREFTAPGPAAELSGFPDWPNRSLPSPALPQAEGVAVSADGCGFVVASEASAGADSGSLGIVSCS